VSTGRRQNGGLWTFRANIRTKVSTGQPLPCGEWTIREKRWAPPGSDGTSRQCGPVQAVSGGSRSEAAQAGEEGLQEEGFVGVELEAAGGGVDEADRF